MKTRVEPCDKTIGIILGTYDDERPHNYILLYLWNKVITYYPKWFPFKPYKYVWHYGDTSHLMIAEKSIGLTLNLGDYARDIVFRYGADTDFTMGENGKNLPSVYKIWRIPWLHTDFKSREFLNFNGVVECREMPGDRCKSPDDMLGLERIVFAFSDGFDDTIVYCSVYREVMTWTKGISWMSWLKYVTRPTIKEYVVLNFSDEVGKGKHEWKGGVVGTSCEVLAGERPEEACIRWCKQNGHRFIRFVMDDEKRIRVFKNQKEVEDEGYAVPRVPRKPDDSANQQQL